MPIQTLPGTDTDTDLLGDFSVPCDVIEVLARGNTVVSHRKQCDNPANFSGTFPCCGHLVLACEHHVKDGHVWSCGHCHRDFGSHKIGWNRL